MDNDKKENPILEGLLAERERLLAERPELISLQEETDFLLGTTLDTAKRLEISMMLMAVKAQELGKVFAEMVNAYVEYLKEMADK